MEIELEVLFVFCGGDCDFVESCLFIRVMILFILVLVVFSLFLSLVIFFESLFILFWGCIGLILNLFNKFKLLLKLFFLK